MNNRALSGMHVTVLCFHTSPLAQPGLGDGGGMNVYVRELSTALARAGVTCDVYSRADAPHLPPTVAVEPGFRVHNVVAGPRDVVSKDYLPELVPAFTEAVAHRLDAEGRRPDVVHANYWLSAVAGHELKHRLDVPLVTTFHTLAKVKTLGADPEPEARAAAEQSVIGCSDAILASCRVERDELVQLYGAADDRIEEVPLGVDHAFFSPGSRHGARAALGLGDHPVLLFVGRIQPLKGADVAVRALAALDDPAAVLLLVGGPSGPDGPAELARLHRLVDDLGLRGQVRFVAPQPHHLLSTYYRAADVCVVPSRSESFGLVALEAGACGTPVVAACVGGLQTLVDQGRTGFLVEGRDPVVYAGAVDRILRDPHLAAEMGAAAAARSRRYAWSYTAARLRRLYGDLTARSLVTCA